jgi:glutamyl-tRNA(Gln) amidotransferase subunit E
MMSFQIMVLLKKRFLSCVRLWVQRKRCGHNGGRCEKRARGAMESVIKRAKEALTGVPEETRKALPDGNSSYLRPLPGAARMYPEN